MGRQLNPKSKRWAKMRKKVFKRDGKCYICNNIRELTAHHIKPRADGGKTEIRNLLTVCKDCHNAIEGKTWTEIQTIKMP